MREDVIQQALGMLQSPKVQSLPLEQKKTFLAGKLTEEEISEVFKRLAAKSGDNETTSESS